VDDTKWYEGQHNFGDPERKHIYIYIANPTSSSLYFNTTLSSPNEFTSHWDLLNPKWQGKFVTQDPLSTGLGATMIFFYHSPELGPEFIRRLFGTMNATYGKDRRQITDWLVQGKFAICLGCRDAPRAKSQGLPVDEFDTGAWKEGKSLSTGGGSISLIKGAPNPNAARVFINWFLSRKGQSALQKHLDLYGEVPPNSRRIDIPKEDLPPESRLIKGRKYLDVSRPEWQDMEPIFKLVKEVTTGRDKK
jgi:iron(III) transport system substrate-binding protein